MMIHELTRKRILVLSGAVLGVLLGAKVYALDLVRKGRPACTIVIPQAASRQERTAAATLTRYLKMATGAELRVLKESGKPKGTLISIGETRLAQKSGPTTSDLKWDGYHLSVRGNVLYLWGRDTPMISGTRAQGTVRAVFGLLDRLGFHWLQPTPMGIHIPQLKTITIPDDLDVTYNPPFMFVHGRFTNWGDWSLANSFRTATRMFVGGETWVHGVPASLFQEHPEYFVMRDGKRIKPTNPKNPQYCLSNPDAQRLVAKWAMRLFKEGYEVVALGQSDGFVPCQCPLCSGLSASDQVHNALRNVAEIVGRKYPDRKLHVLIYNPNYRPPTQFATYPSNTIGQVCLTELLQTAFGSHDQAMDYWRGAIPGGITVYTYYMGLYYDNGLAPRFYPELAAAKIRDWIAHDVQGIYWCGGGENWGAEGPTYYVIGRLATDPSLDWQAVYQEYLNLTFGNAAPAMKQYYDTLYGRLKVCRHSKDDWVVAGVGHPDVTFTSTYPAATLQELRQALDAAKQEAAGDVRVLGWIRRAEISYQQYALITQAFLAYRIFMLAPTASNRTQVIKAVNAYQTWVATTAAIATAEPIFASNFFPDVSLWTRSDLKTNHGHLQRTVPFNWTAGQSLPGRQ